MQGVLSFTPSGGLRTQGGWRPSLESGSIWLHGRLPPLPPLKATRRSPRPDHEMVRWHTHVGVGDLVQIQMEAMRLGAALGVRNLDGAAGQFRLAKPAGRVVLGGVMRR